MKTNIDTRDAFRDDLRLYLRRSTDDDRILIRLFSISRLSEVHARYSTFTGKISFPASLICVWFLQLYAARLNNWRVLPPVNPFATRKTPRLRDWNLQKKKKN